MNNKKIAGIVCEYNPFHTGHLYQIEELRKMGYEKIVCVMSGNTVQRGEVAVMDKYSRAAVAVHSGADLVLELPYPYSSSGAEFFAAAAVKVLSEAGVDTICFGSECAEIEKLRRAAWICESTVFAEEYKNAVSGEKGTAGAYFEAFERAAEKLGYDTENTSFGSNDILGISYIRAIIRNQLDMIPITIKREGSAYKDEDAEGADGHPSALMIRKTLGKGTDDLEKMMPKASFETLSENISKSVAPCSMNNIERAVLAFFRLADTETLAKMNIAEAGGGLAERICKCAKTAKSYEELVELVSGKKYTKSRVRRVILAAMTGVTESDIRETPAYSTVLSFNGKGREILASLRKRDEGAILFVTKPADAPSLGERAARQFTLSEKVDALFTLSRPTPAIGGEYIARSPIYLE